MGKCVITSVICALLTSGVAYAYPRPKVEYHGRYRLGEYTNTTSTGTLGVGFNNPGNIEKGTRLHGQTGARYLNDRFVVFSEPHWGLRGIGRDMLTKFDRGLTSIADLITVYAPPFENDTANYIKLVSSVMHVGPQEPLNIRQDLEQLADLIDGIVRSENSFKYDRQFLLRAANASYVDMPDVHSDRVLH